MKIEFIVNSKQVDLSDNANIPLNIVRRVSTSDNKPAGGYSKVSVTVPATGKNISIFEGDFGLKDCQIYVDGILRFSGKCQARKGKTFSDAYGAITESYMLNLFSDNSNWWLAVKDIDLGDVIADTIELTSNNILDRFTLDATYAEDFRFGIVKRGQWSDNSTTNGLTLDRVKLIESTPLYYVRPLIEKAFNSAGYKVNSTFFNNDDFKNLVIPCFQPEKFPESYSEKYLNGEANLGATTITTTNVANFDSVTQPNTGTPFSTGATPFYTAPETGFYEVTIELEMPATPSFNINTDGLVVLVGLLSTPPIGVGFSIGTVGLVTNPYKQYLKSSVVHKLEAGEQIELSLFSATTNIDIVSFKATVTGEAKYQYGALLDFSTYFKGQKAGQLIKGVQHLFNLVFEVDEDKKIVTIEPDSEHLTTYAGNTYNEGFYKNQSTTFKDYTRKVDYLKQGEFEYKSIDSVQNFAYKQDSEATLDYINSSDEIKAFDAQLRFENGNNKTATNENPFFAKTLQIRDVELIATADRDTEQIPLIPLVTEENYFINPLIEQSKAIPTPRILYFFGNNLQDNGQIKVLDSSLSESDIYCPVLYSMNVNDAIGNYPSLSFSDVGNIKGLLSKYYLQFIARQNSRLIRKNYIRLLTTDLLNFSFRDKILIDSKLYIAAKMSAYNPTKDEAVEFELIEDRHASSEDIALINNSIVKTHTELG